MHICRRCGLEREEIFKKTCGHIYCAFCIADVVTWNDSLCECKEPEKEKENEIVESPGNFPPLETERLNENLMTEINLCKLQLKNFKAEHHNIIEELEKNWYGEVKRLDRAYHNLRRKFEAELSDLRREIEKNQREQKVEMEFPTFKHTFTHVWRIDNFTKLQNTRRISKTFYTASSGYKMSFVVYPNGNFDSKSTHVAICLRILRGKWDEILKWPISYNAKITLISQGKEAIHHSIEIISDSKNPLTFDKPKNDRNRGWGKLEMISLPELKPLYLVNDQIFVRIDIDINI